MDYEYLIKKRETSWSEAIKLRKLCVCVCVCVRALLFVCVCKCTKVLSGQEYRDETVLTTSATLL